MIKDNKHIHKFKRDSYSTGKKFYYCINGNCTFKIDVKHSLGKLNICHTCGNPFNMNEYSIRAAKPKCNDCVKRRTIKTEPLTQIEDNNANNVDNIKSIIKTAEHSTSNDSSVKILKDKINNLTIKEFNPDDEDVSL